MARSTILVAAGVAALGAVGLLAASSMAAPGFIRISAVCWGTPSPTWTSGNTATFSYTPTSSYATNTTTWSGPGSTSSYQPASLYPTNTATPNSSSTTSTPSLPGGTGAPQGSGGADAPTGTSPTSTSAGTTGPTSGADGPRTTPSGPAGPTSGGTAPPRPRDGGSAAPPSAAPSRPRPTARPTTMPRPGGAGLPGAPRPGMSDAGSPGSAPSGPRSGRGRGAGLDWHQFWGGERLHFWPGDRRSAARTETAGNGGRPTMSAAQWAAALDRMLDGRRRWTDRAALAEGLTYCNEPALIGVTARLATDRQPEVKRLAVFASARALGDGPGGMGMLLSLLNDRRANGHPRGAAAAAMGGLGDPAARPVLLRTLRGRHEVLIRIGAAIGLGRIGAEPEVQTLTQVADQSREETPLRTAAIVALGRLARSPRRRTRVAATRALVWIAARAGRLPIEARQTLALNLGHCLPTAAVYRVLTDLCHDDGDMRTRSCAAIGWGYLARAHPAQAGKAARALTARWTREPQSVKAFLALGLGIGRVVAERRRVEQWLLDRGDPCHRGAAAVALGLMGDAASIPALVQTCKRGAARLRGDAAEGLGYIGGAAAAAELRAMLQRGKGPGALLGAAAYALGVIGQPQDLDLLAATLGSGSPDLRTGGVYGLGAYGGPAARDRLLAHTAVEPHPTVRALAFYCSGLAMAPRAIAAPAKDVDRSPWAREH